MGRGLYRKMTDAEQAAAAAGMNGTERIKPTPAKAAPKPKPKAPPAKAKRR